MRLYCRNLLAVGPVLPFSSASREMLSTSSHQVISNGATTVLAHTLYGAVMAGETDAVGSLYTCCPSRNSSSARRCHPPAAGINAARPRQTRRGAPGSTTALPSSPYQRRPLSTLFCAECGREHCHLQLAAAFRNCLTVFPPEKRDLPSQHHLSDTVSALA